jgi:hypothetical protein
MTAPCSGCALLSPSQYGHPCARRKTSEGDRSRLHRHGWRTLVRDVESGQPGARRARRDGGSVSACTAIIAALAMVVEPPIETAPVDDTPETSESEPELAPQPEPADGEATDAPPTEPAPTSTPAPAPRPRARATPTTDDAAARAAASGGIGGYGDAFDLRGRPPRDGEDEVLAGSIVLPLGILGAASSGVQLWLSMPGHCESRWGSLGSTPTAEQCKGVYAFSIVRVVHSSLMAASGAVLLGIGLHRRKKYREWHRGSATSGLVVSPWLSRTGAGLGLALRF